MQTTNKHLIYLKFFGDTKIIINHAWSCKNFKLFEVFNLKKIDDDAHIPTIT